MPSSPTLNHLLDPNIDYFLNPFIPHNQFRHLPKPIARFLGYRSETPKEPHVLIQWALTVLATVAGICLVGGVYNYAPAVNKWNPPPIVASLGASAVLQYNAIRSPLAQPRNAIMGHTVAAIVGTGIAKAFMLAPNNFFSSFSWVAAAVACAGATLAMSMTNSVHPPGGATAILACTQSQVIALGWMFPPMMLLASVLMTGVAVIFNNTFRQYPVFWWTPEDVGQKLRHPSSSNEGEEQQEMEGEKDVEQGPDWGSEQTLQRELSYEVEYLEGADEIHLLPYKIRMPHHITLSDEEVGILKGLQERIRTHSEVN